MKIIAFLLTTALFLMIATVRIQAFQDDPAQSDAFGSGNQLKAAIDRYLGKPYVWGASGLKGFDCSGFVWRVFNDHGIYIKRTTARKLYMSLQKTKTEEAWNFGNVVFFDNLKHCGIVCDRDTFYHAESSVGVNRSSFKPYWKSKIVGVRQFQLK